MEDYESEYISRSFRLKEFSWFVPEKIWLGLESDLKRGRHFRGRTNKVWDLLDFWKRGKRTMNQNT